MCLVLTVAFIVAAFSFYAHGFIPHAIASALIALVALVFLIRKVLYNGRCIFGKARDCNRKK